MLELADIRDWLKSLNGNTVKYTQQITVNELNERKVEKLDDDAYIGATSFYIGKLNNKKEKSIGVYQLKQNNTPNIAIGGLSNTKYCSKPVSILIHWNKDARETEVNANVLYKKLQNSRNFKIKNILVNYIQMLVAEPVDVGTDDANVYERVIQAIFYYKEG